MLEGASDWWFHPPFWHLGISFQEAFESENVALIPLGATDLGRGLSNLKRPVMTQR
jgi:hypothetical protein